ncbi:8297_t:CDS:2 [Dentiscutata erythropus]|uniref:8297_t:CDS:1 n=1 Tax=Dentiscutata erythropus TaxID=1348616 RepID=A0A9N8VJA2_9GLOM|nr:8297_t:CDS:2 [Dentiscutata erythropus]
MSIEEKRENVSHMPVEEKRENESHMPEDANYKALERRITTPYAFTLAVSAQFMGYIIFDIPSTMVTNILGFNVWIPIMMVCWAVTSMSQAACTNVIQLGIVRFLLGSFEAAFPPSVTGYIGLYYARKELTLRYSFQMVITIIAGALSGFASYFILQISGTSLSGFQWLFIIGGIPTLILALITAIFITRGPENARFFTPEERVIAVERLKSEGGPTNIIDSNLAKAQFRLAFSDVQSYFYLIIVLISAIPNFALNFNLPTLVNQLGYDNLQAQLMVIPPILVATVFTIINAWCSDKYQTRTLNILVAYSVSFIGLVGLIATLADDPTGQYKRSTVLAMIFVSAQVGGIIGILVFPASDAPSFLMGNIKRDLAILANHKLNDGDLKDNKEIREIAMKLVENEPKFDEVLCDKHPNWRYII